MPTERRRLLPVLAVAVTLVAVGCGGDSRSAEPPSPSGRLQVFAAASLTEPFTELGRTFQAEHPRVRVSFTFGASSALARQINDGAPADVFASADERDMEAVTTTARATDPRVFARNRLALLVEEGNPKGIRGLPDLARPGVVFVLCAPEVPCGRFAAAALAKARVLARPASLEENVKAVVSRVVLGEADVGVVYATDVRAARGEADGVAVDSGLAGDPDLQAVYVIATTRRGAANDAARAWVDHVLSPAGRATLQRLGFLTP